MQISARDLLFANNIFARRGGIELSGGARLKVARVTRAIRTEAETISETLSALARELATKDANGNPKTVQTIMGPEFEIIDQAKYLAEKKRIEETKIEIAVDKISESDLGDKNQFSDEVDALLPFMG